MAEVTVRPARPDDLDALVRLDTTAPRDPSRAGLIRQWVAAGECHVAEAGGEIVGYGVLNDRFFHQGNLDMLMVRADWRRRGVGRSLLRHLASLCPSPKFWVTTNRSNRPMRRLLESEGFTPSGQIDNLDKDDPELVYVKRVDRHSA
jgi:ribosomal protein S18 acetylase RimI-like enzyme